MRKITLENGVCLSIFDVLENAIEELSDPTPSAAAHVQERLKQIIEALQEAEADHQEAADLHADQDPFTFLAANWAALNHRSGHDVRAGCPIPTGPRALYTMAQSHAECLEMDAIDASTVVSELLQMASTDQNDRLGSVFTRRLSSILRIIGHAAEFARLAREAAADGLWCLDRIGGRRNG